MTASQNVRANPACPLSSDWEQMINKGNPGAYLLYHTGVSLANLGFADRADIIERKYRMMANMMHSL
jgi:hypothetical protein